MAGSGSDLPLPGPAPLPSREVIINETTRAIRALNKRREDLDISSPCEKEPRKWDAIDDYDPRNPLRPGHRDVLRLAAARSACLGCPVWDECKAVADTVPLDERRPEVTGWLADRLISDYENERSGKSIMHYLATGEWKVFPRAYDGPIKHEGYIENRWDHRLDSNGCLTWLGRVTTKGAPTANLYGKAVNVRRQVYVSQFGDPGEGRNVLVTCGNRLCGSLDHLALRNVGS